MKPDHPENSLDSLLNDLSYEPAGELAVTHQAPAGLRQQIMLAQQAAASASTSNPEKNSEKSSFTQWFRSPWRAMAACAAPLLVGVLLGSNATAAEFYATSLDQQSYPDDNQLLVIASLDTEFVATLGDELLLDFSPEGEPSPMSSPTDTSTEGVINQ